MRANLVGPLLSFRKRKSVKGEKRGHGDNIFFLRWNSSEKTKKSPPRGRAVSGINLNKKESGGRSASTRGSAQGGKGFIIDRQKLLDRLVCMAVHMAVMAAQRDKSTSTAFLTTM